MGVTFMVYSLAWGSALALMASGLSLYYSVSKVANFAHGSYVSMGLLAYLLAIAFAHWGSKITGFGIDHYAIFNISNLWALIPAFLVAGLVSLASFAGIFWPLMKRGATPLQLLVASIGLMFVLRFLMYIVAGSMNWITLWTPGSTTYHILGVRITLAEILSFVLLALVAGLIALLETKTLIGVSLRAIASNPSLAEASGIDSFKVQALAWFLGGGFAGLGGVLMFIFTGPPGGRPIVELGWMNLLSIFAAAVLGGLGSFYGTIIAALILGIAFNQAAAWFTIYLNVSSSLALLIPFGITLLTLLFFPQGLAGINWRKLVNKIRITRVEEEVVRR